MAKKGYSREAKVGIFAILCIAILYLGFNYLKGINFFTTTNKYYAIYDDVVGLNVSNPVTISGFGVGRVSDIRINQNNKNRVLVEMDVSDDIVLGAGTSALLKIDILGSVSIVLDVGDISRPLSPGDTVEAKVDPTLYEILEDSALPLADNLKVMTARINRFLEDLLSKTESIKGTIDNLEGISAKLNSIMEDPVLDRTISGMGRTMLKLDTGVNELRLVINKFGGVADSVMTSDLSGTLESTKMLMSDLRLTLQNLNDENGTLGRLMKDDSIYINLNKTLVDLDSLLIHINQNPKHFFAPLGKSRKKIERELNKK